MGATELDGVKLMSIAGLATEGTFNHGYDGRIDASFKPCTGPKALNQPVDSLLEVHRLSCMFDN